MRDHLQLAAGYQAGVLAGTIPACRWVRLACARNRRDLDHQETPDFPYRFDPKAARKICEFAELLPHIKGPKAVILGQDEQGRARWNPIVLEPWQCWILTVLFGWMTAAGKRRFRVALVLVPRKNAKSTLGAIIALYLFAVEGGSGAECYSAATTRDQAKIVAEIAWEMTARTPLFREAFKIRVGSRTTRTLTIPTMAAKFAPLSADAQSLDGLNILLAIVDELHAHRTRAVWDVIDTATGTQLQPLIVALTTAGIEVGGICHEKLGYLEKILDQTATDETFFGINYTIDPGDDIRDPLVQRKANPNYAVSVQPDDLERKVQEAQQVQSALNNVLTKHFNVWIRTESSWMSATTWQGQRQEPKPSWEDLRAVPCWIGVDLGEVRDYSAVVLLFRAGETYTMIPHIYVPENAIALSPIAALSGWVHQGDVIVTPGDEADYSRIEDDLVQWVERLTVQEIDFDRRSARLMIQKIKERLEPTRGRDAVDRLVIDVPQSTEVMDPALKTLERLVVSKKIAHDGNACMAWMISNIVTERNHRDEIYPRKAGGKDSANKIDGPVALFTCLSQAMRTPPAAPKFQMFFAGGR